MKNRPHRVYLDSNVIIAFLTGEVDRASVVQSLFEDAQDKKVELVTSVLSVTEVAFIASDQASSNPLESEEKIDRLWAPASPVNLVEFSIRTAKEARAIIRQSKSSSIKTVKPADAIHLASATIHECDRLFTYEREDTRVRWQNLVGFRVDEPFLYEPRLDIGE